MIPDILKTAGQIAGIGGLALGVFLILFREVIRKNIFPNLTKGHAYKLLRMIIILVFSVAVVGILAWVYVETREPSNHDKTTLLAEFVLDGKGNPQFEDDGGKIHYQIMLFVKDAPPEVTSISYDPHDSSYGGDTFSGGPRPDFKTQPFTTWGDLDVNVILSARGAQTRFISKLSTALEQNYGGKMTSQIWDAIKRIKAN